MLRRVALAALLLSASARAQSPATQPFTLGPDTTLITGPLLPDGTIDYVSAINAEWSKGITPDNNAVPLLALTLLPPMPQWDEIDRLFAALHLPVPAHTTAGSIVRFSSFMEASGESLPNEGLDEMNFVRSHPFAAADHPLAAQWLAASADGFKLLEQAADRPRWDYPFLSKPGTTGWIDAMPQGASLLFAAGEALAVRAMSRAGAADIDGARADINRMRRLARIAATGAISIDQLAAMALSIRASQSAAGLASLPSLTAKQLQALRDDLASPALQFPDSDDATPAEKMVNLDSVMMCIRGDGGRILYPLSIVDAADTLDTGDLQQADWNTVLKDANAITKAYQDISRLPTYHQRKDALEKRRPALIALNVPGPALFASADRPSSKSLTEAFLKLRPGETRDAFSHRIATLLFDDPESAQLLNRLVERKRVYHRLAQIAVDLADHHRLHHAYPDALAALRTRIDILDPLADAPFHYTADADSFTLYSVGLNEHDDHGHGDDFSVTAGATQPPR